jgi:hypothetical protein
LFAKDIEKLLINPKQDDVIANEHSQEGTKLAATA